MGEEDDWKEGLMKTGDWGELTGFMINAGVSVLGCIRFGFLGTELRAGLYMAYCADILADYLGGSLVIRCIKVWTLLSYHLLST